MSLSARNLTDWCVGMLASIVQHVRILEEEGAVGIQLQPVVSHGATTQVVSLSETSLVPRPHPSRERGSGDFAQKPRSSLKFTPFRQEFQTANQIVEKSILSLLGARSCRKFKFLLQLRISFHA